MPNFAVTVLYCTAQNIAVQCRVVWYSNEQQYSKNNAVHNSAVQKSTVNSSVVQAENSTVRYSAVRYSTLQCSTIEDTAKVNSA